MGELVAGRWRRTDINSILTDGRPQRPPSVFRDWVTADGSAPEGARGFKAERGRYHLYVSLACPWAHRTLIMRNLKALDGMIGVSVVHWLMGEDGWTFEPGPGVVPDPVAHVIHAARHLYPRRSHLHLAGHGAGAVRYAEMTIVSNESADIIRMFNAAFDHLGARPVDYYPAAHRAEIDAVNARIYETLNNGVYKAGFATKQLAYEEAVAGVFDTLDWLEARLTRQPYLVGNELTEADIRLFTTLVRFDVVYYGHFKCNRHALTDYPALWNYTRALYQHPDIRPTINFAHIKGHYYGSHPWLNPSGIVPVGPDVNFDQVVNANVP